MKSRCVEVPIFKLTLLLAIFIPVVVLASAAKAQTPNTISINPALLNLELLQGEAQISSQISITNNYSSSINLGIEVKGIDQISGQLVPTETVEQNIKDSLVISDSNLLIQSGQTSTLTITVTNSDRLAPGGHYATLLLTERSLDGPDNGLKGAASVGIFIVKRGGSTEILNFKSIKANGSFIRMPSTITAEIENNGNTHTVPRGVASVSDGDKTILKGVLNDNALPLLPGKQLSFTTPLQTITNKPWLPVRLSINLEYRADGSSEIYRQSISRWYFPPFSIIVSGLLTLLSLGIILLIIKNKKVKPIGGTKTKDSSTDAENSSVKIRVRRVKKVIVKSEE